ncbi:MAG: hypothetical protein KGJ78_07315 [Alphaproteobacteria bacterium]|nr:hypothetical protein [Alphaproteobacteria bacterium]
MFRQTATAIASILFLAGSALAATSLTLAANSSMAPAANTHTNVTQKNAQANPKHHRMMRHHRKTASMGRHRMAKGDTVVGDREVKALNVLEAAGYQNFQDLHPQGQDIVVHASKNGQSKDVMVTPDGQIQNGI